MRGISGWFCGCWRLDLGPRRRPPRRRPSHRPLPAAGGRWPAQLPRLPHRALVVDSTARSLMRRAAPRVVATPAALHTARHIDLLLHKRALSSLVDDNENALSVPAVRANTGVMLHNFGNTSSFSATKPKSSFDFCDAAERGRQFLRAPPRARTRDEADVCVASAWGS